MPDGAADTGLVQMPAAVPQPMLAVMAAIRIMAAKPATVDAVATPPPSTRTGPAVQITIHRPIIPVQPTIPPAPAVVAAARQQQVLATVADTVVSKLAQLSTVATLSVTMVSMDKVITAITMDMEMALTVRDMLMDPAIKHNDSRIVIWESVAVGSSA